MKKFLSLLCAVMLCAAMTVPAFASDDTPIGSGVTVGSGVIYSNSTLYNLENNCPNTGVMVPSEFSPYVTSYILTVASWVSRVYFTPYCYDNGATITVNGVVCKSGSKTQTFTMTDKPQQVTITVTGSDRTSTTYTVFLQRRPSEKRTRVSAGYISSVYYKSNTAHIKADLVTVKYSTGNQSTFTNSTVYYYDYACSTNCIYYYGTIDNPIRAYDESDFMNHYQDYGSNLYRIVYIEDEIVAVMPYDADYWN